MTLHELRLAIGAERSELAEILGGLSAPDWDAPTLCAGWRVREVVAHITMPLRYSTPRFVGEIMRSGGRFNRMADRCARRDAKASTDELLAGLKDNASNPWKPPGGGFEGALTHDVIHGLDITVALGVDRGVPPELMRIVLNAVAQPRSLRHFGVDVIGRELIADDLDWSFGCGAPLVGSARDLALMLCGRSGPRIASALP